MINRRNVLALLTTAAAVAPSLGFAADAYPTGPVTLVHQYTPGGTTDIVARLVGDDLKDIWGEPVVIDSRPGGGGIIGAEAVASAKPDGQKILLTITALSILPAMHKSLPFDVEEGFTPVAQLVTLPFAILTSKKSNITTIQQLVDYAKEHPDTLNCASVGIGSPHHLALEAFQNATGITIRHVPYKGAAGIMTDLTTGVIDMTFLGLGSTTSFIEADKVNAVGMTGPERSPLLPDVPTVAESGYPDYVEETWYGILGPAGMSDDIVKTIFDGVTQVLAEPESVEKLSQHGMRVAIKSPEEFKAQIHEEVAFYKDLTKKLGIAPE